jgi:hypothetical protein
MHSSHALHRFSSTVIVPVKAIHISSVKCNLDKNGMKKAILLYSILKILDSVSYHY